MPANRTATVLHEAVREEIVRRIETGLYEAGQVLPSADALGREFGVSVITIKRALRDLQTAGLLRATAGLGTFVKERRRFLRDLDSSISSIEDAKRLGLTPSVKLISITREKVSDPTLKTLSPPEGLLLCVRKVVLADDTAVMFDTTYLPSILSDEVIDQFSSEFVIDVLRRQGVQFARTKLIIDAAPASQNVQQAFGVPTGYPTLRRLYQLSASRPDFKIYGIAESPFDRLACTVELNTSETRQPRIVERTSP